MNLSRVFWAAAAALSLTIAVGCGDDSESGTESGAETSEGSPGGGEEGSPGGGEEGSPGGGEEGSPGGGEEGSPGGGEEGSPEGEEEGSPEGEEGSPEGEEGNPVELTCATYCALISSACTGNNAQFASEAACLAYCNDVAGWTTGTEEDTNVNTLGCRIYHATVAGEMDPAMHCPHAGPTGGAVCGTYCDTYCNLAGQHCTGGNALYADDIACQAACASFPTWGMSGDSSGDHVQCRIYHLGLAAASPAMHCPHASEDGDGVCVDEESAVTYSGPGGAQSVFQTECGLCHQGASVTGCSGGTCFASFYEATQLPSNLCAGMTMGECSLTRMNNGSMPPGPGKSPQALIDIIQAWVTDGQLP